MLVAQEQYAEAEAVLEPVLETYVADYPTGHFHIARTRTLIGRARTEQGHFGEAEQILVEAAKQIDANSEPGRVGLQESRAALVHLYEAWGRPDAAATWRKKLSATQSDERASD